ncbi:MAG: hypothetical protein LBL13_12915 [Bacteroidales bacterium]|nr:hypothetical protein [Bacteroidales bacterium]
MRLFYEYFAIILQVHSSQIDKDYLKWISDIKRKVRSAQISTALAAKMGLIMKGYSEYYTEDFFPVFPV